MQRPALNLRSARESSCDTSTARKGGSPSGVLEAVKQLSSALGVAVLGTIFFSALGGHIPTHALAITAWACLVPLAATFLLLFKVPMRAREPKTL